MESMAMFSLLLFLLEHFHKYETKKNRTKTKTLDQSYADQNTLTKLTKVLGVTGKFQVHFFSPYQLIFVGGTSEAHDEVKVRNKKEFHPLHSFYKGKKSLKGRNPLTQ